MKRREFITLLGGAAVAWPLAARAQQPAMPVIGVPRQIAPRRPSLAWLRFAQGSAGTGLHRRPYVAIEFRWAEGRPMIGCRTWPPNRFV